MIAVRVTNEEMTPARKHVTAARSRKSASNASSNGDGIVSFTKATIAPILARVKPDMTPPSNVTILGNRFSSVDVIGENNEAIIHPAKRAHIIAAIAKTPFFKSDIITKDIPIRNTTAKKVMSNTTTVVGWFLHENIVGAPGTL